MRPDRKQWTQHYHLAIQNIKHVLATRFMPAGNEEMTHQWREWNSSPNNHIVLNHKMNVAYGMMRPRKKRGDPWPCQPFGPEKTIENGTKTEQWSFGEKKINIHSVFVAHNVTVKIVPTNKDPAPTTATCINICNSFTFFLFISMEK